MKVELSDIKIQTQGFEINNSFFPKKDITEIKTLNIEARFINEENASQHIVLDKFAQTGIFSTPKFYVVTHITLLDNIVEVMISKRPVYYGSNQYYADKKKAEEFESLLMKT